MANTKTHASKELIYAMRGEAPKLTAPWTELDSACGQANNKSTFCTFATYCESGESISEDTDEVKCPDCIKLMFNAIQPVRRDQLLELGILNTDLTEKRTPKT